jgi:hypothetical protein
MPWEMNVTAEEEKVEVEELRDALMQAVAGYAQALPAMASQGQDPSTILRSMAMVIKGRQKGRPIEEVIAEAFAPPPPLEVSPEQAQAAGVAQGAPGQAPSGESQLPPGLNATGRMTGVAPGQEGMAPGGRPALQMLLAGLSSSGSPVLQAGVSRRTAV